MIFFGIDWGVTPGQIALACVSTAVTAISIMASVRSVSRARRHSERLVARAAVELTDEAISLVAQRLNHRFNPAVLPTEGKALRQFRSVAAVNALSEIKASDLSGNLIAPFIRGRSGLSALNQAMNEEKAGVEVELGTYRNLYQWTYGDYVRLRALAKDQAKHLAPAIDWQPPENWKPLTWPVITPPSA